MLFIRGFVIGLALAAPVGPVSIMVIRRTIAGGARSGLASGMGAAVADAIFAACGALGLVALGAPSPWLRFFGGVFLVVLGVRALVERRGASAAVVARVGHARAFAGTLVFTLASPISILSFAAVAASLGVGGSAWGDATALVTGVFAGSALWWLVLSSAVGLLRRRIPEAAQTWLGRASGAALLGFGAFALAGLLNELS